MDKIIGLLEKYYPVYLQGLWGTLWISAVTVLVTSNPSAVLVITVCRRGERARARLLPIDRNIGSRIRQPNPAVDGQIAPIG